MRVGPDSVSAHQRHDELRQKMLVLDYGANATTPTALENDLIKTHGALEGVAFESPDPLHPKQAQAESDIENKRVI